MRITDPRARFARSKVWGLQVRVLWCGFRGLGFVPTAVRKQGLACQTSLKVVRGSPVACGMS